MPLVALPPSKFRFISQPEYGVKGIIFPDKFAINLLK
jgi:hypothetical protein